MTDPALLAIPMTPTATLDVYSGVARMAGKLWASLHTAARPSDTANVGAAVANRRQVAHYRKETNREEL